MDDQNNNQLEKIRHSTSHIMAYAVREIFGAGVKFAIGPTINDGFYYDFDLAGQTISAADFPKIEEKMNELIKRDFEFTRSEADIAAALEKTAGQPYKQELINDLAANGETMVSFYRVGEFEDLCRGPHVANTKELGHFKLLKIAGAYWRGDEKNQMLQRIYGTAFASRAELDNYLKMLAEAEKRDHKKLGRELDLFSFHEEGPGFPFFHDKGTFIWNQLVEFMRQEMKKRNYQENKTPIILNEQLWRTSGHWDHYRENMYFTKIDEQDYAVKPMNCPGNLLIYKTKPHSYRDLPIKAGEFGLVHRHEKSGVLNGLFRVRNFTQDDAHIFCTTAQLKDQIIELIDFVDFVYTTFGFAYSVELSTKPEQALGSAETWDKAEAALKEALAAKGVDYKLNTGDGAFYGPKIDFHLKDAIGRTWQCGTIQLDFSMPEKFDLEYTGEDGAKHRPVMLHRAIYGSVERFLGILIEHYAGAFPLWLAPVQVIIIPVSEVFNDYGQAVRDQLSAENIRVELDDANESLGKRIRNAEKQKIPYLLIVGEKEKAGQLVAVRQRGAGDLGTQTVEEFVKIIEQELRIKN